MTTNLSGSLGTFGLDEVLSMLGMGGRTAHMEVTSAMGAGEIHLVDGHVSAASSDRGRATLLRQVVAAGDVAAADLARALEDADAVRALVDAGIVDRGFCHGVAVEQIVDALGEMLTWQEGQFAVRVGAEHVGDIGVRLPVDEAVGRGRGRADEWGRVRAALPDEQTVLSLVSAVAEPTTLGAEDWSVLVRIDGRRTLGEVVAAAGCAPLVASGRIVDLMGRGLVHVRTADSDQPDEVARMLDVIDGSGAPGAVPAATEAEADVVLALDVVLVEPDPFAEPAGDLAQAADEVAPAADPVEAVAGVPDVAVAFAVEALQEPEVAAPVAALDAVDVQPTWEAQPAVEAVEAVELVEEAAEADAWTEQVPVLLEPEPEPHTEFTFPVAVEPAAWAQAAAATDEAEPAAGPAAGAVEWSPWAQALGLGAPAPEGELVVDPLAGPGIAEMIAEAHGMADTEHVPVPLAPVVGQVDLPAAPVDFGAGTVGADAVAMPAPRVPGDDTPGVARVQAQEVAGPVEAAEGAEAAPIGEDPLAGGLLAQLMTGVRGL